MMLNYVLLMLLLLLMVNDVTAQMHSIEDGKQIRVMLAMLVNIVRVSTEVSLLLLILWQMKVVLDSSSRIG